MEHVSQIIITLLSSHKTRRVVLMARSLLSKNSIMTQTPLGLSSAELGRDLIIDQTCEKCPPENPEPHRHILCLPQVHRASFLTLMDNAPAHPICVLMNKAFQFGYLHSREV